MTEQPPKGIEPILRAIAMPGDTNISGDIFGGWLMSQMDLAGGIMAYQLARGRVVTITVEQMRFLKPVKVGDIVSLYGTLLGIGRTSLQIEVCAWRQPRGQTEYEKVTESVFRFVAIDENGVPRPVPRPESDLQ